MNNDGNTVTKGDLFNSPTVPNILRKAMKQTVIIVDWVTGFNKIGFIKYLNRHAGLPLGEAKRVVDDRILEHQKVVILVDTDNIDEAKNAIRAYGLVLEGEDKEEREREVLRQHGVPCPFCGEPLKTKVAKQCPWCRMDWHDEAHPYRLGTEIIRDSGAVE
jgi:hypothetical protein